MSANRYSLIWGILLCLSAVLIGAFGSHALSSILDAHGRQSTFELANRYQFYHGLALLIFGVGHLSISLNAVIALVTGSLVFSGSLYLLSVTNIGMLGALTPFGGVLLTIGWALIFKGALANRSRE